MKTHRPHPSLIRAPSCSEKSSTKKALITDGCAGGFAWLKDSINHLCPSSPESPRLQSCLLWRRSWRCLMRSRAAQTPESKGRDKGVRVNDYSLSEVCSGWRGLCGLKIQCKRNKYMLVIWPAHQHDQWLEQQQYGLWHKVHGGK